MIFDVDEVRTQFPALNENDEGRPTFNRLREENADHQIEEVGKELRGMMSFLSDSD